MSSRSGRGGGGAPGLPISAEPSIALSRSYSPRLSSTHAQDTAAYGRCASMLELGTAAEAHRSEGRRRLPLTRRRKPVQPAEDGMTWCVRSIALAPELLFRGEQGWSHAMRVALSSALAHWAGEAGVDQGGWHDGASRWGNERGGSSRIPTFRDAALVTMAAVAFKASTKGIVDNSGSDCGDSQLSDGSEAGEEVIERTVAPFEWRVILAVHRRIIPTVEPSPPVELVGSPTQQRLLVPPVRFIASRPVRFFWTAFPWIAAATSLIVSQLYTIGILETYLEPLLVTDEWLLASSLSVLQGWLLMEPLIVLMRNNIAAFARARHGRLYQLLEQFGCSVFFKIAKWVTHLV